MYNYIISKENIPSNKYKLIKVKKDGNCFYSCLSTFLYCNPNFHTELREIIAYICKENINEISNFQENVESRRDTYINTKDYINLMSNIGNWATSIDITVSVYI